MVQKEQLLDGLSHNLLCESEQMLFEYIATFRRVLMVMDLVTRRLELFQIN